MQETPIDHPGVPQEVYHTMGKKTFWIFFLERSHATFILLILTIVLFAVSGQSFLRTSPAGDVAPYVAWGAVACSGLFVIFLLVTLLIAWLVYVNFKFSLGEDSLKIKRGILNKTEVAIPYRQIQDVDLDRDLSFQILGLSRIVILTAGHEDDRSASDQSEGSLPALDKDLAEWLQAELLRRANVQKVTEEAPAAPPPAV